MKLFKQLTIQKWVEEVNEHSWVKLLKNVNYISYQMYSSSLFFVRYATSKSKDKADFTQFAVYPANQIIIIFIPCYKYCQISRHYSKFSGNQEKHAGQELGYISDNGTMSSRLSEQANGCM